MGHGCLTSVSAPRKPSPSLAVGDSVVCLGCRVSGLRAGLRYGRGAATLSSRRRSQVCMNCRLAARYLVQKCSCEPNSPISSLQIGSARCPCCFPCQHMWLVILIHRPPGSQLRYVFTRVGDMGGSVERSLVRPPIKPPPTPCAINLRSTPGFSFLAPANRPKRRLSRALGLTSPSACGRQFEWKGSSQI